MLITKHGDTAVGYTCKSCNCEFVATKLDRKIEQNMCTEGNTAPR